jgi:organic radical activating enzyme
MTNHNFCPAKWLYVSVDLQNAMVHSCHYPPAHHVPLKEVKENLNNFHNSKHNLKQQGIMLKDERPRECSYCWDLEDQGLKSPRHDFLDRYPGFKPPEKNQAPKYLEVSFSNRCQLKCSYCNARTSSSIAQEYQKYGPYLYEEGNAFTEQEQYQDFFWQWFKSIYNSLEDLRITGGEPFLDKNLAVLLKYIERYPHPRLKLSINTNLSFELNFFKSYVDKIEQLIKDKKIKSCSYFTSIDASGRQATYIRHGLDLKRWHQNISYLMQETKSDVVVTNTFNILSISSCAELISEILRYPRVKMTFSRLVFPHYLSIEYAGTKELKLLIEEQRKVSKLDGAELYVKELEELILLVSSKSSNGILKRKLARFHLRLFLHEYDKRKGISFIEHYPELAYLYGDSIGRADLVYKKLLKVILIVRRIFPNTIKKMYY